MEDILNLIKSRRSIRKYRDKHVEREKIRKIMEAARWAPSARNSQPWKFFVREKNEQTEMITELAYGSEFVGEAPVLILACGNESKSTDCIADVSFAIENLILEAHSLGLGTCIIGYFDRDIAKSVFKIDEELTIFYMITLGYPDESLGKDRKALDEVFSFMEE